MVAGITHVRSTEGGGATAVFTVGFCFGGRVSFNQASSGQALAGVEEFGPALDADGVQNELVSYENAPHSFFDRDFAEHERACRDAWARVLGFIEATR